MSDPRRLLDDPEAPAELKAALAAERHVGALYDPSALGARVAQAVAAGAPLSAGAMAHAWWLGPKALIVTAAVSAALGAGGHAVYIAATAPSTVPPVVAPAPAPMATAPAAPIVPVEPVPASSTPAPAAPRAPRAPAALADELRLYERGEAALVEGHYEVAVRELERYLGEFPKGTLRAEAELGLVQALAKSGRCDRAQARVRRASGAQREALRAAAARCGG
ncbi:MAG: hypothetical protein IT383_01055 [Deltaproteobacteria bacterium]|nr:hypothetical protein [Deltaproteobacteria bacterium]